MLALLVITVIQSLFIAYNILDNYSSQILRIPGILAEVAEYLICLLNIHILQVFSVLNSNLTEQKLFVWKIIVTVFFIVSVSIQLWILVALYTTGIAQAVLDLNGWICSIYTIFAVLYDNIQGIYLIILIWKNKKRRGAETAKVLHRLMLTLICLAAMDWLGVVEFLATILFQSISNDILLYNSMMSFAELYTCIHGVSMIYLFKQLTDFTFVDTRKKREVESKPLEDTVLKVEERVGVKETSPIKEQS
ncbi:hypothetical protein HDV04_001626, partial [Boothiomyces sp. JEL0838]